MKAIMKILHTVQQLFKARNWGFREEKLAISVLFIAFFAFTYFSTEHFNANRPASDYINLSTFWDSYVPLTAEFVVFYYLYYLWAPLPAVIAQERRSFYHIILTYTILQLGAALTFILIPARMFRMAFEPSYIWEHALAGIYTADPGVNLLPSLHVGHSVLTAIFFYTLKHPLRHIIGLGSVFISASTILVKQHYVIDIPFGILYAVSAYFIAGYFVTKVEQSTANRFLHQHD